MDEEELRQIYDALSARELIDELAQRGLPKAQGAIEKHELIDQLLRHNRGESSTASSSAGASGASSSSGGGVDASKVADFCSLTGADADTARHMLEAMGGDLEQAVSFFLDSGGVRPPSAPPRSFGSGLGGLGGGSPSQKSPAIHGEGDGNDDVRAPLPTVRDTLMGGRGGGGGGGPLLHHSHMDALGGLASLPGGATIAALLNPALQAGAASLRATLGGGPGDDERLDWMFKAPEGMSIPLTFQETRAYCKEQQKWLLVNIQDHENFASHRLNRDVWVDDTIQCLVQSGFIFWQRNKTSAEGQQFISRYHINEAALPIIAIIDPRTGGKIREVEASTIKPMDLSTILADFLDQNQLDSLQAPKIRNSSSFGRKDPSATAFATATASSSSDDAEDEELMKAIALSMAQGGGNSSTAEGGGLASSAMAVDSLGGSTSSLGASSSSSRRVVEVPDAPPGGSFSSRRIVEVPDAPPKGTPVAELCRISLRLADGKRERRNFYKTDKVECLFAYVESKCPDAKRLVGPPPSLDTSSTLPVQEYELTMFPNRNLNEMMQMTMDKAGLDGTSVSMRFTGGHDG